MKQRLSNLDNIIKSLKPYLSQYLAEHEIDTSIDRNFKCIDPKHDDTNASMHLYNETVHCFGCIHEDEYIWTNRGLIKIKDVVINDKVLSLDGKWNNIYHVQSQEKDISKLTTDLFRNDPLFLTADHNCIVVNKNDAIKNLPFIVKSKQTKTGYVFNTNLKYRKRIKKYNNVIKLTEKLAKDINNGDYILFPHIKERKTTPLLRIWPRKTYKGGFKRIYINELPINNETAYLFGLYLAEGSIGKRYIRWSFHIKEENYANTVINTIKKYFKLECAKYYREEKTILEINCSNCDLTELFEHYFGKGAKNKKIPIEALSWPKEIQQALINGWLDGDGAKDHIPPVGTTISQKLVYSLFITSIQAGLIPSITKHKGKSTKEIIRQDYYNISFIKECLRGFIEPINQENYTWIRINSFETTNTKARVIDLSVENNPSFTTKLGTVHNCGATYSINQVCSILENRPSRGREWIEDNVLYLAKKYNIHIDLEDLTQEEIYEYRTYCAYRLAADLVANIEFGDYNLVDKELSHRKWDKEKTSLWGIGTVNYDAFRERLKKAGFEPRLLDGIGLSDPTLFNETNLIFTVTDDEGRPVGFSAKRLVEGSGPRYTNTRQTGLECAIFKKGERLYGYDVAKEAQDPLYIFEGSADVITARHHGLMNCCGLMGTALTDHHIALLKKHGSFKITLAFDGDEAGRKAIEKAIDDKFSGEKDFLVSLCPMPEGMDPDELIRERGFDEFVRLKRWTAFEWRMLKFMEEHEGELTDEQREEIANKMTPIIVSEKNHFRQEQMAKQVAKMTGYDLALVMSEVKRRKNEKEAEIATKKTNLIESFLWNVRKNPDNAEIALTECQHALNDINKSIQIETEASLTFNTLQSIKEEDEKKTGEFAGFYMKPDGMFGLGKRLNEDWKKDTLIYIGGSEQAGKSTVLAQMLHEIADDSKNNAVCLYFSIDDPAKRIAYKWICNATNDLRLQLNWISNPNYWTREHGDVVYKLRNKGYKKILAMAQEGKLILKDASNGTNLVYMKNVIRYYKEKNPLANIVVGIDSFHKLSDYTEMQEAQRTKRLSNDIKEMCNSEHITTACTVEYRKLAAGERPDNNAISQSKALSYDADVIIHLYNDLQVNDENRATFIHEYEGKILPRISAKFGKNKISGYIGYDFLDLFPYSGVLKAVDKEVAKEEYEIRKQFVAEHKDDLL